VQQGVDFSNGACLR